MLRDVDDTFEQVLRTMSGLYFLLYLIGLAYGYLNISTSLITLHNQYEATKHNKLLRTVLRKHYGCYNTFYLCECL